MSLDSELVSRVTGYKEPESSKQPASLKLLWEVPQPHGHFCGGLKLVTQDSNDSRITFSRQLGVHRAWGLPPPIMEQRGGWFLALD